MGKQKHLILRNQVKYKSHEYQYSCLAIFANSVRMMSHVTLDHKTRQTFVLDRVDRIADHAEDIKTRQNRLRQIHLRQHNEQISPQSNIKHHRYHIHFKDNPFVHYTNQTNQDGKSKRLTFSENVSDGS